MSVIIQGSINVIIFIYNSNFCKLGNYKSVEMRYEIALKYANNKTDNDLNSRIIKNLLA